MDASRLSLCVSLLAGDDPVHDRVAAAAARGYRVLESWWPWPGGTPSPQDIAALAASLAEHEATLHLMNLSEGGPPWGGRGMAGIPAAEEEFWANARTALDLTSQLGIRQLHALAGNVTLEGPEECMDHLERTLAELAALAAPLGAEVVVEHLNRDDHPDYLLADPLVAVDIVRRANARSSGNVGLLADVYHLARTGLDVAEFIGENAELIRHVQLADFPGRGRPGTGDIPIKGVLRALDASGYKGFIGLEFLPDGEPGSLPSPEAFWRILTS